MHNPPPNTIDRNWKIKYIYHKKTNLQIRDEVEIQMQDKSIVIKKYEPEKDNRCVFCASQENLQQFKGSWICGDCLQELVSK